MEIRDRFQKFKEDWPSFGVTLMCDSWTGPTRMSVVNFMIYCNGVIFFHKSVDATGKTQDADYLLKVCKLFRIPLITFQVLHSYFC
jgi:hypothetical protein